MFVIAVSPNAKVADMGVWEVSSRRWNLGVSREVLTEEEKKSIRSNGGNHLVGQVFT